MDLVCVFLVCLVLGTCLHPTDSCEAKNYARGYIHTGYVCIEQEVEAMVVSLVGV